ncbi:MAG: cytidylate kinase family protein, partial [Clostridia bacterium]|nr:cytidylate kinase family protein [Clostridia bacterium]
MKNFVITIGRQYGSGGREIGEAVARRLGLSFYDKELITASVKESGMDAKLILQVHDELLIEADKGCADEALALLREEMENAVKLSVPLDVGIAMGENWFD